MKPLVDFRCTICNIIEEHILSESPPRCPKCTEHMQRMYTFSSAQFKGSGFYKTDKEK